MPPANDGGAFDATTPGEEEAGEGGDDGGTPSDATLVVAALPGPKPGTAFSGAGSTTAAPTQ